MDEFEKNNNLPEEPEEMTGAAETAAEETADEAVEAAEAAAETIAEEAEAVAEEGEAAAHEAVEEAETVAEEAIEEAEDTAEEAEAVAEEGEAAAEDTAEAADDAAPQTPEDALVQELEGIRDLLQQELDHAGETDETADGEAGETEEAEEAPEDIPEEERCRCCGEKRRDQSFGEDYPYCADCRKVMKHAPIRVPALLMTIVAFALAIASLYFCGYTIADYTTLIEAEQHYSANELTDAAALYANYVSQKNGAELAGPTDFADNLSMSAVKHAADTFARLGYLGDANEILTKFLGEEKLQKPANAKYLVITEDYEALSETSAAINQLLQDVLYYGITDGVDFAERDKQLQDLLVTPREEGKAPYNAAFVEFYRYVLLDLQGKPAAEQLAQLQTVRTLDEDKHPWLYLGTMTKLAAMTGDAQLTEQYAREALKINAQDAATYTAWANVYRFGETPDAERILQVAENAKAHFSAQEVPTYLESFAIAYLLQGKDQEAMQTMEEYMSFTMSSGYPGYSVTSCNLYALCSVIAGNQEGYDEMAQVLASAGLEPSKLIKQYEKGKITITELLQDQGGAF